MAFCNNCDSKLIPGATKCPACGKPVNSLDVDKNNSSNIITILKIIGIIIILGIATYFVLTALKII